MFSFDDEADDVEEVDVYDAIREVRAKAFLEKLSEDARDLFLAALEVLAEEDNRPLFWDKVRQIQQVTNLPKDECRELLNFIIDDLYD